jgi:CRISPR-associated protein Csx10
MSIRLEFEIALSSDYHVGAGYGLGPAIDSALLRDADNVPALRGTMINGLLRQGLYDLLQLSPLHRYRRCQRSGLDSDADYCGQWHSADETCPICSLFGTPARMKRWHISSARPLSLEKPQRNKQKWQPGATAAQINTRVRVNPRTRRAANNQLFSQENGDGRLRFCFNVECLAEDESAWAEAAWLVAAARMVRRLGSARRRGRGECEITLVKVEPVNGQDQETLLDRLAAQLKGEALGNLSKGLPAITPLPESAAEGGEPYRLWVWARLDEPLLVSRKADTGNQFETVQSIPGTILRGALAWRMAHRFGAELEKTDNPIYRNFVSLLFGDAVRFSALLPLTLDLIDSHQAYPSIAVPKDLVTCELRPGYATSAEAGHGVWSKAKKEDPEKCPKCIANSPTGETVGGLKSLDGFITLNSGDLRSDFAPKQSVEMHISLNPHSGRVRGGELFGFVTLDPGQYFIGEIVCANNATWETLRQMSGLRAGEVNRLRMGKASRRGHGALSLLFTEKERSPWHGPDISARVTEDAQEIIMTFLSDAVIVDDWGRAVQGFADGWLQQELNLPDGASVTVDPERCFSAARGFQSFNAKLGLPKPRDTVLVAGSAAHLSIQGIALADLQALLRTAEEQGIGLRRNEGFGLVAFNHPVHSHDWHEGSLDLPEELILKDDLDRHKLARLRTFEKEWQTKLATVKEDVFAQARLESPARLLQVIPGQDADQAVQRLQQMGQQTQVLERELKGRDKINFYQEGGDGWTGMSRIYGLLKELGELIGQQEGFVQTEEWQLWKIGLEALADAIAGPARQNAKKAR